MIGQTISHYKIIEKLGEGGMGVVYKAEDTKLKRVVALKFLPGNVISTEEELRRFEQEAEAISALNHPNIATIHDIDESEGRKFLVLEYLPGGTLKSKIRRLQSEGKEFSIGEVIEYGIQIAEGLAHAHRHQIIHRDIKSDNVMLTAEGKLKLTDFGLAKLRGAAQLTRAGSTLGTAAYMSPEQIRGDEVDGRSDLFSLGVLLYELTTLRMPFRGEHEAALTYSIVNEPPTPMSSLRSNIHPILESVINKCLEKDPDNRYGTADEIARDLRSIQYPISGSVKTVVRHSKLPWIVAAVIAILAIIGIVLFIRLSHPSSANNKTIAVLPFINMSGNPEDEYFSDGMTEDILTQLSKVADLRVISRTSVMQYKGTKKTIRDIGKELNAGVVLEGSVRRAADQVRIAAQLIDANTDEHLWAETYDKEFKQVFAIQSDVAQKIAAALQARLSPTEKERIEKIPTANMEAYSYYLSGRESYYRYSRQENEHAIELFRKALELDNRYALAYAGLGDAIAQRAGRFGFPTAWLDSSIAMSETALTIDPNLAEAHKSLGLAYEFQGRFRKAIAANRKAIDLNPNFSTALGNLGDELSRSGNIVEGLIYNRKAYAVNPTIVDNMFSIAGIYYLLGDDATAKVWFEKGLNIRQDALWSINLMTAMEWVNGRNQRANELIDEMKKIDSTSFFARRAMGIAGILDHRYLDAKAALRRVADIDSTSVAILLGYVTWKIGDTGSARNLLDAGVASRIKTIENGDERNFLPYEICSAYAVLGEKPMAYTWLQRAIDAGWRDYRWMLFDPTLENLRDDEQFKQIITHLKGVISEMRLKVEEMDAREKQ